MKVITGLIKDRRRYLLVDLDSTPIKVSEQFMSDDIEAWNGSVKGGVLEPTQCRLADMPSFVKQNGSYYAQDTKACVWCLGTHPDGRVRIMSSLGNQKDLSYEEAVELGAAGILTNATTINGQLYGKCAELPTLGGVAHKGPFTREPANGDAVLKDCYNDKGKLIAKAGDLLTEDQVSELNTCSELPPVLSALGLSAASASALALYGTKFREELEAVVDLLDGTLVDASKLTDKNVYRALPSEILPLPWLMRLSNLDTTTQGHCLNVALFVGFILQQLGRSKKKIKQSMACALLHDVGKLKIEKEILTAKRALTAEEFGLMKQHPKYGYDLLDKGSSEVSRRAALVAYRHHVKKPGFGYPPDVAIEDLTDIDFLVQFCDIFDALVTRRPYKEIIPPFKALEITWEEFKEKVDLRTGDICVKALQEGFIGSAVTLTDGQIGKLIGIIECNPVGTPVVELSTGKVIMCRESDGLDVTSILGVN